MHSQKTTSNTAIKTLKDVYKDAFLIGSAVNQEIESGTDKASQGRFTIADR